MAKTIRESTTSCARNDITDAQLNKSLAARMVGGGRNGKAARPGASLSGSAADANEIYGEIFGARGSEVSLVSVQTTGLVRLKAIAAFAAAMVGQGVLATTTAGVVKASGTVGLGKGRIYDGETIGSDHYYYIDLDA